MQTISPDQHVKVTFQPPVGGTHLHIGPLPPPETLAEYEKLQTGLAERIICMAEIQSQHRREVEKTSLDAKIAFDEREHQEIKRGQYLGFFVSLFFGSVGGYLTLKGYSISGIALSGGALASIVTAFILGRQDQN